MKHVVKGTEPACLAEFKQNNQHVPQNLTYNAFREKTALLSALAQEQGYICPYTQIGIDGSPLDAHIEHIVPQSPQRATHFSRDLDCNNMLACYPRNTPFITAPGYGATQKGNQQLDLTPLDSSCETRLHFEMSGQIRAVHSSDQQAEDAIRVLRLDHAQLIEFRKEAIEARGFSPLSAHPATEQEIQRQLPLLLQFDANGRLAPFCIALYHAGLEYQAYLS